MIFIYMIRILILKEISKIKYDIIIIAVAHKEFKLFNANYLSSLIKKDGIIFDLKNFYKNKNFHTL